MPEMEEQMAIIRSNFLESLDGRMIELENLLALLKERCGLPSLYHEIQMRVHKIAGVAGTLGFAVIGEYAAACETAAVEVMRVEGEKSPERLARRMDELLDEMDRVLENKQDLFKSV